MSNSFGNFTVKKYSTYSVFGESYIGKRDTELFKDISRYGLIFFIRDHLPRFSTLVSGTYDVMQISNLSLNKNCGFIFNFYNQFKTEMIEAYNKETRFFSDQDSTTPLGSIDDIEASFLWNAFIKDENIKYLKNHFRTGFCNSEVSAGWENSDEVPDVDFKLFSPDLSSLKDIGNGYLYIIGVQANTSYSSYVPNYSSECYLRIYEATATGFRDTGVDRSSLSDAPDVMTSTPRTSERNADPIIDFATNKSRYYMAYSAPGIDKDRLTKIVECFENGRTHPRFKKINKSCFDYFKLNNANDNSAHLEIGTRNLKTMLRNGEVEIATDNEDVFLILDDPLDCGIQIAEEFEAIQERLNEILGKSSSESSRQYLKKCVHQIFDMRPNEWMDYLNYMQSNYTNTFQDDQYKILCLKKRLEHLANMAIGLLSSSYTHEFIYDYIKVNDESWAAILKYFSTLVSIAKTSERGEEVCQHLFNTANSAVKQFFEEKRKLPTDIEEFYEYQKSQSSTPISIIVDFFCKKDHRNLSLDMIDASGEFICKFLPYVNNYSISDIARYVNGDPDDIPNVIVKFFDSKKINLRESDDTVQLANYFLDDAAVKKWNLTIPGKTISALGDLNTVVNFFLKMEQLKKQPDNLVLKLEMVKATVSVTSVLTSRASQLTQMVADPSQIKRIKATTSALKDGLSVAGDVAGIVISIIKISRALKGGEGSAAAGEAALGALEVIGLVLTIAGIVTGASFTLPALAITVLGFLIDMLVQSLYATDEENWIAFSEFGIYLAAGTNRNQALEMLKARSKSEYWTKNINSWNVVDEFSAFCLYRYKPDVNIKRQLYYFPHTVRDVNNQHSRVCNEHDCSDYAYTGMLCFTITLTAVPIYSAAEINLKLSLGNTVINERLVLKHRTNCFIDFEKDVKVNVFIHLQYTGMQQEDWNSFVEARLYRYSIPTEYRNIVIPINIPINKFHECLTLEFKMESKNSTSDYSISSKYTSMPLSHAGELVDSINANIQNFYEGSLDDMLVR